MIKSAIRFLQTLFTRQTVCARCNQAITLDDVRGTGENSLSFSYAIRREVRRELKQRRLNG